jgi:nicotinate-nucleotide--dimethylbenzimidazole phosphoribosyltransferase
MSVDLALLRDRVEAPDESSRAAALARLDTLVKPVGSLGRLEELAAWLSGVQGVCPPQPLADARLMVFAGDHGVAQTGVSAYPPEVTAAMVRTFLSGGAAVNALARTVGADVTVFDLGVGTDLTDLPADVTRYKVRRSSGDITVENAITPEECETAFGHGMSIADDAVDSGADVLLIGDMGIGNTTAAAALVGLLTGNDPAAVTGRGTGIDDLTWMRKCAAVRDAMRRGRPLVDEQLELLAAVGSADLAAAAGFCLQAAIRRTPLILDGVVTTAAALVAHRIAFRAGHWWLASHRSVEPAHCLALTRMGLEPLLDLQLRLGEGTGALLALPLLRSAQAALAEMSTLADLGLPDA